MPKYGLSPWPSQTQAPSGARRCWRARVTAGSVRRDGVSIRPTWSRRIIAASWSARAAPADGSSRWRPLEPPTSTVTSGRGSAAMWARQASAASARRCGVTRCSAVRVTTTFGPVRLSWRLTTIRSKRRGSIRGCWTWTTGTPRRRSAASTGAALPPQPITTWGRGPCTASAATRSGAGQALAAIQRQGARGARTRSSWRRPAASARPIAWDCIPARASHRIQASASDMGGRFSAPRRVASIEKEKAMHQKFADRIEAALTKMAAGCLKRPQSPVKVAQRVGKLLGRNTRAAGGFKWHMQTDEQGQRAVVWTRNPAWKEWVDLSDGSYLLRSNILNWSPEDLWTAYMQLTEAEGAFRISKSDLKIRPIWHQNKERVNVHILVCLLWPTCSGRCWRGGAIKPGWKMSRGRCSRSWGGSGPGGRGDADPAGGGTAAAPCGESPRRPSGDPAPSPGDEPAPSNTPNQVQGNCWVSPARGRGWRTGGCRSGCAARRWTIPPSSPRRCR